MLNPPGLFYSRQSELASLIKILRSPHAEMVILVGRRGVGKSALLREVMRRVAVRPFYYLAIRRTLPLQLETMAHCFQEAFPEAVIPQTFEPQTFGSAAAFFEAVTEEAQARENRGETGPMCLVLAEFSHLADEDPGLPAALAKFWEENKHRSHLKIFLSSADTAFMRRQVLPQSAPLYSCRAKWMEVLPLDYFDAARFFPKDTPEEKMTTYAVLGGMPAYLSQFFPPLFMKRNVLMAILQENTYLALEPERLLQESRRSDVVYGSILQVIAGGLRTPLAIALAIGKRSAQDISPLLSTLQKMGLLRREVPITEKASSRHSRYYLADNYLDFWYRFVEPALSQVSQKQGEQVWEQLVTPSLVTSPLTTPSSITSPVLSSPLANYISYRPFRQACHEYLKRRLRTGTLPSGLEFTQVGSWWRTGKAEIDIVAVDKNGTVTVAGSCKWQDAPMDVRDYIELQQALAVAGFASGSCSIFLFSRSGFTAELRTIAAAPQVSEGQQEPARLQLVALAEMYPLPRLEAELKT